MIFSRYRSSEQQTTEPLLCGGHPQKDTSPQVFKPQPQIFPTYNFLKQLFQLKQKNPQLSQAIYPSNSCNPPHPWHPNLCPRKSEGWWKTRRHQLQDQRHYVQKHDLTNQRRMEMFFDVGMPWELVVQSGPFWDCTYSHEVENTQVTIKASLES